MVMSHIVSIVPLLLSLLLVFPQTVQGTFHPAAHTLPSELQSVNGSSLDGGCNNAGGAGDRFCSFSSLGHTSNLVDGVIPPVDNFDGGWANGFFTLNKSGNSSVMVGFDFVEPVNITQVELILFHCPAFGIGASNTSVYTQTPDFNGLFNFRINLAVFEGSHQTESGSCDSTVNISIPLSNYTYLSRYLFLVFNFNDNNPNDWVFIAETKFSNESTVSSPTSTSTFSNTVSSATPTPSPPPGGSSSATIIIAVVVAFGGVIITLCIIAIIVLFFLHRKWRNKRSQIENLQSVIIEHEPPSTGIELTFVKVSSTKDTQKAGDSEKIDNTRYYSITTETSKQNATLSSCSGNLEDHKSLEASQPVDIDNKIPEFSEISPFYSEIRQPELATPQMKSTSSPSHSPIPKTHSHTPAHTKQEEPSPEHIYTAIEKAPHVPKQSDELLEYLQTKPITGDDTDNAYSTIDSTPSPPIAIKPGVNQRQHSSSPPCVSPQRNTSSPTSHRNRHSPSPSPRPIPSPRRRGPSPIKLELSKSQQLEMSSNSVNRSPSSPGKQSRGLSSIARRSWSPQPGLERHSMSPPSPSTLSPTSPLIKTQQYRQNSTGLAVLTKPMCDNMLTNTSYQSIDTDVYAEPGIVRSASDFQLSSAAADSVYSEPIQPSLFRSSRSSSSASPELEDIHPYAPIYTVPTSPPQPDEKPIEVTGADIKEICKIGSGNFGEVILAQTVGLSQKDLRIGNSSDKNETFYVAVKKLGKGAPRSMKEAFEKEARFMGRLRNENVVSLLAVCYTDTPFLMMEYMEKGDLNQYLQKYHAIISDTAAPIETLIKTSTLLNMCTQIASAMKYLASHNFVHRDLATRNCLVGQNNTIKIADFGMSRNLYESHYYRVHGAVILPIRWMAIECFFGKFSQKSDVWAFGVTMWEIYTLGKITPYSQMSDHDLIHDAQRNEERSLLTKPEDCPQEVYNRVMLKCWKPVANDRPTFLELHAMLSAMQN